MAVEVVAGKDASIYFDASKCIHSRGCVLSHPDVFVPNVQGEWIHPFDHAQGRQRMNPYSSAPANRLRHKFRGVC